MYNLRNIQYILISYQILKFRLELYLFSKRFLNFYECFLYKNIKNYSDLSPIIKNC